MRRYRSFLVALSVLFMSAVAQAQQVGGSALQGRVIDQQQAVLPGVNIIITNQDNGTFRETVTGPDGQATVTVPTGQASRLFLQFPEGSQIIYTLTVPAGLPTTEATLFVDPIAATTTTPLNQSCSTALESGSKRNEDSVALSSEKFATRML